MKSIEQNQTPSKKETSLKHKAATVALVGGAALFAAGATEQMAQWHFAEAGPAMGAATGSVAVLAGRRNNEIMRQTQTQAQKAIEGVSPASITPASTEQVVVTPQESTRSRQDNLAIINERVLPAMEAAGRVNEAEAARFRETFNLQPPTAK